MHRAGAHRLISILHKPSDQNTGIKDAASLIVVKNPATRPQVLLGKRAASNRFMPNRYVFPGGGLQAEDYRTAVLSALDSTYTGPMGVRGNRDKARALACAAVRETFEETGLLLSTPEQLRDITHRRPPDSTAAQPAPMLGQVQYIGRATTPVGLPMRFNARFFVAPAERFCGQLQDSDELSRLDWFEPRQWPDLSLAGITMFILQNLDRILAGLPDKHSFIFRHDNHRPTVRWARPG